MGNIINNPGVEQVVSPRTKITNFKAQARKKTAHGLILGLNMKFKKDVKEDPEKHYSARELEILFGEKVRELNITKSGIPPKEIIDKGLKLEGSHCQLCGQKIKQSWKMSLCKGAIETLFKIYQLIDGKEFIKTKEIYTQFETASATAELTKLKYLGAIYPYYNTDDYEKESQRPGKWALTKQGKAFINRNGKLPSHVVIKNECVLEKGEEVFIDDERLQWLKEEDIWEELKEHWNSKEDLKA